MKQVVTVQCPTDGGDFFVHYPSGKVQFLGFIEVIKLAWYCIRNDVEIKVLDD